MKRMMAVVIALVAACLMAGCVLRPYTPKPALDYIKGDIEYEFRVGRNAAFMNEVAETDAGFDKDRFVDLFNEYSQYNPNHLKYNLDECDLKINAEDQPEEYNEMKDSEINISISFEEGKRSVSVFDYDSTLYFFVLCMGGNSEPDEIGYYYMELSDEMESYWRPILSQVREEAEVNHLENYGSFSLEEPLCYDGEYYIKLTDCGEVYLISVYPSRDTGAWPLCHVDKDEYEGVCWEEDTYNVWIQSSPDGVCCYSYDGSGWAEDPEAVRPDYIISKYD